MPLHPDMLEAIQAMADFGFRPMETLTPEEAREQTEAMARLRADPAADTGLEIAERAIPVAGADLPARLYRPEGAGEAALPALVYFHGGGHVIGSLDTHHHEHHDKHDYHLYRRYNHHCHHHHYHRR